MMDTVKLNENLISELEEKKCLKRKESMNQKRKANLCDDLIKMRRRRRRKLVESNEKYEFIDDSILTISKMTLSLNVYLYCLSIAIVLLNVTSSYIHCHTPASTNTALEGRGYVGGTYPMQAYEKREEDKDQLNRYKRSPVAPSTRSFALASLLPSNELRMSGSKNEPPSRPSVDWSKQRPYFGPDMVRNVSVELGKTAYLTCKVYELGDKTVSWLRPRENEILTAGKFTYIGDPRFASINDNGSHDWILEIKDVGLNDSTNYECQVSTDPKMSTIINLHVKAAKARIKQGELYYAHQGSNIEFTCEIGQKSFIHSSSLSSSQQPAGVVQQTYWYFNGNLLNYARTHAVDKNFSIDWDPITQISRFKLFNIQQSDAGNYTCKPTSSESATVRLFVKRHNKNTAKDRAHNNGYHSASTKEAQKNRQHYGIDSNTSNLELLDSSSSTSLTTTLSSTWNYAILFNSCLLPTFLLTYLQFH